MSAVEDSLETQARIGALRCEGGPHSPTGHLLRQLADEIERLNQLVDSLRAENFRLAAAVCIVDGGLVGSEGGTPVCTMRAERDALRAEVATMKKLLEEVWAYIPPDCGWDYDVGGYLQDRLSAALAEKQEAKEKP